LLFSNPVVDHQEYVFDRINSVIFEHKILHKSTFSRASIGLAIGVGRVSTMSWKLVDVVLSQFHIFHFLKSDADAHSLDIRISWISKTKTSQNK